MNLKENSNVQEKIIKNSQPFRFQQKKESQEFIKMEKLENLYLTDYNLLKEQDLWQPSYQILPIIF